jgi:DUF1680 family protein
MATGLNKGLNAVAVSEIGLWSAVEMTRLHFFVMLVSPFFQPLPLGTIQPRGWLQNQLQLQADGLTGHLDEFWPSVKDSHWIGGEAEGWERGPYWLDGLIPLAFLLDDKKLQAKAKRWIDHILREQHEDGWLGAKDDVHEGEGLAQLDPWPLFVLFKAFLQWHDATNDPRIVPALVKCARRVQILLQTEPLRSWAKMRWADFVFSLHQLHELTGENWLLELAATCKQQGYNWNAHFADLPMKRKTRHEDLGEQIALPLHGVNNAMGLKTGAVWWRQSGQNEDLALAALGLRELDKYHGSATGMFNADEHLAGLSPSQGFETCAIVEEMFSLEIAGAVSGDAALFDRLEQITFNALPASCTSDMWAHQYHQQTNQVLCSLEPRDWTDSGPRANLFGQDVNFGCCQANLHQGWPKFAQSLWMKSASGLTATAYAPCIVSVEVDGVAIEIEEITDYPFRGEVRFKLSVESKVSFRLRLRVPAWAKGATWQIGDAARQNAAGGWIQIERVWQDGDEISLLFPMPVRREVRPAGALCLHRGPLLLALPLGEEWRDVSCAYTSVEPRARERELLPDGTRNVWNYALELANFDGGASHARERVVGQMPFDNTAPPIVVAVSARRVFHWNMRHNSAAPPPTSPVLTGERLEVLELVPYGCARLRVAEFPASK